MRPAPRSGRAPTVVLGLALLLASAATPAAAQATSPHLIYATDDAPDDTLRLRGWNDHPDRRGWSSEIQTTSATSGVNWVVSARSPFGNEAIVANLTTGPGIDVLRWDGNYWTVDWSMALAANTAQRGAAVAYEQSSGDALVVHFDGTSNLLYRVWDGTSWTADVVFDQGTPAFPGTGTVDWVELAADPTSDRIALVYSDSNDDVHAVIWDGSDWDEAGTETTLGVTSTGGDRAFDVAYETSGDLMVAYAVPGGPPFGFDYDTMASSTTIWAPGAFVPMYQGGTRFLELAAEPGGDRIAAVILDTRDGLERLGAATWTGSVWVNNGELATGFPHWETVGPGPFWGGVSWVGTSGEAVLVASDDAAGNMGWANWTAGAGWTWQGFQAVPGMTLTTIRSVQVESFPGQNRLMAAFSDDAGSLRSATYDGATWSFSGVLNANLSSTQYKPFSLLGPATPDSYGYLKPITIDRMQIPGGCGTTPTDGMTLTDFPMLYSVTDPALAHTSSAGNVTDLQGDDIVFKSRDDATCGGVGTAPCQLDHEIEDYDPATGELVAWVRIPSVNTATASSDTSIFIYYGNATVTAPTENPTGVWDTGHVGVWHLHDDFLDSTSGANDGTNSGSTDATGAIANGQSFDGLDDFVYTSSSFNDPQEFTLEAWFRTSSASGTRIAGFESDQTGEASVNWDRHVYVGTDGQVYFGTFNPFPADVPEVAVSPGTYTDDAWHHVVGVRNDTTNTLHLYVDGVEVDNAPSAQAEPGIGYWRIGSYKTDGWPSGVDGYFPGNIDEVRISAVTRSACWVNGSYNNQDDPGDVGAPGFYTVGASVATAVELVSFEAAPGDGMVDLRWETGAEIDNLGFHLYRSLTPEGPYERITAALVPGLGSSPEGARYGYRDLGLANGVTYFYQLEDVETTGDSKRHGPVSAAPFPAGGAGRDRAGEEDGPEEPAAEALAWIAYGDPEATSLHVVKRGPGHAVVELETRGFYALADEDGSVWLSIPGFEETNEAGAPALPVRLAWLEAVAGRKVRLATVVGRDVQAFTGLRPGVTGERGLFEGEGGILVAGRRRRAAGVAFRGPGLYPEEAARVLTTAFQGDVKKAQLELSPLRWDRSSGQLLLARRLRVRVVFAGLERDELTLGGRLGRRPRRGRSPRPEGVVARLAVRDRGLYAVGFEELFAGRGVSLSGLALSRQGEPVAFHVEPAGRRFERGSVLYFTSDGAVSNPHGPEAVYELSLAGGGVRMPVLSGAPHGGAISHYWQRDNWEVNRLYQPTLLTSSELWFWDYVASGWVRSYPFQVDALAGTGEAARLQVWLHGGTDYPADPDHHLRVSVNGSALGEASWDGEQPYALELDVASGVLREGENSLELENLADTGAAYSVVILDRFALSYPRGLVASGGELQGRFSPGGGAEIQGLGAGSLVLDTTETVPLWLTGVVATDQGLGFRAEPDHRYLAVSAASVRRPEVRPAQPSDLRDAGRSADYLLIAPREFLGVAEPLLAHRRSQGLESEAVAIEEIFDEFGHGEGHPEALRRFLGHAYHSWEKAPRYVLLLGDATYDFKGYYGTGIESQVPPYLVKDSYLWTVSDPAYASVNGDDLLPDLALGRLPAQSLEQAETLVQKVLAWEQGGFDLSGRAVLVADNPDAAGDFENEANRAAELLSGREVERIYLRQLGGATRSAIAAAFDGGSSLMSYFGHGSIPIWASENVFNFRDVPNLAAQDQQPFLLTMNCLNGYFHLPTAKNSLSEELLKAEGKGVVGAFSPSSLSVNWAAGLYHQAIIEELTSGRHERLGDAVLAAQVTYAEIGARTELLAVYQLLADPALRLK